jgi:hypothetical protein
MPEYELKAKSHDQSVCEGCGRAYNPSDLPNDSRCEDCHAMLGAPQIDDEHAQVMKTESSDPENAPEQLAQLGHDRRSTDLPGPTK